MSVFQSEEHLYTVMNEVFVAVSSTPQHIDAFVRSNLVVRIRFSEPDGEILLDGRQPPLEFFYGPRPGKANLEISLSGDLIHAIWLGRKSTSEAFFGGQIKTQGSLFKMMKLVDLFRECERVYGPIAAAHGLV